MNMLTLSKLLFNARDFCAALTPALLSHFYRPQTKFGAR